MPFLAWVLTALALMSLLTTAGVCAADGLPTITVGTQEVGLTAGYLLPHRLTQDHTTKRKARPSRPPG